MECQGRRAVESTSSTRFGIKLPDDRGGHQVEELGSLANRRIPNEPIDAMIPRMLSRKLKWNLGSLGDSHGPCEGEA